MFNWLRTAKMTAFIKYSLVFGLITLELGVEASAIGFSNGEGGNAKFFLISARHSQPMTIYLPTPTPSARPADIPVYPSSDDFEEGTIVDSQIVFGEGFYDEDQTEFVRESNSGYGAPAFIQSLLMYGAAPFSYSGDFP